MKTQAAPISTSAVGARVLLVDDIDTNLTALETILEPLGCQLVRVTSGLEALRQVQSHDFALVLMDVMMPDLDGLATARLIKGRAAHRHLPIIFLTARDLKRAEMLRAYALGAVDYLVKPLDADILRSKVAVFVALYLQGQELKRQTALAHRRDRDAFENRRLYEFERVARSEAEAVARAREQIIAVVSHDLRNPMTSIAANAEMIRRAVDAGDSDGVSNRAQAIQRGVARMEALVRDLFDTTSIQSGSLTVQPQVEEVAEVVNQVAELLRPVLAEAKQALDISLPPEPLRTNCDRERIFQVLSNLIGNASKFSPEDSAIAIQVIARPREITFSVIDHGCGIAPDHLPHLFEPYWRASDTRREGLGLGLAIAKGIVEAHGGRIWVESRPGLGTTFHFTLAPAE
jgi:signal transduction histidine kinase